MRLTIQHYKRLNSTLDRRIASLEQRLYSHTSCNLQLYNLIRCIIHQLNRDFYSYLVKHKNKKLKNLCPTPKPTANSHAPSDTKVVCIPDTIPLSSDERSVLKKGLKFIPLRPTTDKFTLLSSAHELFRKLKSKAYFDNNPSGFNQDNIEDDLFYKLAKRQSHWTPNFNSSKNLNLFIHHTEYELNNFKPAPLKHSNLTAGESRALACLRTRTDIVIKPADKGGAIVVWDKDLYTKEAYKQLSDSTFYSPRLKDGILTNNTVVTKTVNTLIASKKLPKTASSLRIFDSKLGRPSFYLLPKIHKSGCPGRPIISACACPTETISSFLDSVFKPRVEALPSYLKDTNHAILTLESLKFTSNKPRLIFLLDVVSLYTSIPHKDGLLAIKHFFNVNPHPSIDSNTILRLTELVLNLNSFEFDGQFFDQISGVAMGTKMGPSYACLFMGYLEGQIQEKYTGRIPCFYRRYIDDGLGITEMAEEELQDFISFCNNYHPNIKFTSEISESSVNFLDMTISLNTTNVGTTVYYKPTDSHSYLLYSSSHPPACKNSIPFSQLLRLRRICQDNDDFRIKAHELLQFFRLRSYPEHILQSALHRITTVDHQASLQQFPKQKSDRTKLILPYHPHSVLAKNIIKNYSILKSDPHLGHLFQQNPLVVYRRERNLRDLLVRSRLPPTTNTGFGTTPCPRKCNTCLFTLQVESLQLPKGTLKIKNHFNCESRNVVYVIKCRRCNIFYIGQTGKRLSDRVSQHLRSINNEDSLPVAKHFNKSGHDLKKDFCNKSDAAKAVSATFVDESKPL
ncbi:uncharacterized protein LOC131937289 [Physella acuta]|uniref:uncharacterized protein LOC131937289 n=1 Tax=Physella acuta TaxID=109671 RepID=UPI0027DB9CFA|nr:uncharacterized protein LOC131937289 [Physella acuta]